MLEELLNLARQAADTLASSPVAQEAVAVAKADVATLEGIAAKHASAAEAWAAQHAKDVESDVRNWFISRLHPDAAPAAQAALPAV
jgi:hypothetical protein